MIPCNFSIRIFFVYALVFWSINSFSNSDSCSQLLTNKNNLDSMIQGNENAHISPENYRRPNRRNLELAMSMMGDSFNLAVENLRPNQVVVDSGAGYGLSSAQIALDYSAKVYAINAQDMWAHFREQPPDASFNGVARTNFEMIDLVNGLRIPLDKYNLPSEDVYVRGRLRKELNTSSLTDEQRLNIKSEILKVIDKLTNDGKYNYIVSYVEVFLSKISEKIHLFYDLYGAMTYSSDRLLLLDQVYRLLDSNGNAFFRVDTNSGKSVVMDSIEMRTGGTVSLQDWLVQQYPTIFKFDTVNSSRGQARILIMKRDPNLDELNLKKTLKAVSSTKIFNMDDMELPGTIYKEQ